MPIGSFWRHRAGSRSGAHRVHDERAVGRSTCSRRMRSSGETLRQRKLVDGARRQHDEPAARRACTESDRFGAATLRAFFDGSTTIVDVGLRCGRSPRSRSRSRPPVQGIGCAIRTGSTGGEAGMAERGPTIVTQPNASDRNGDEERESLRSSNAEMINRPGRRRRSPAAPAPPAGPRAPRSRTRNHATGRGREHHPHRALARAIRPHGPAFRASVPAAGGSGTRGFRRPACGSEAGLGAGLTRLGAGGHPRFGLGLRRRGHG